jgi:hypothetical protein
MASGPFLAALVTLTLFPFGVAAQECSELPRSELTVYRLAADHVTEHTATPGEIARLWTASGKGGPAPHALMAIVNEIETKLAVVHRLVGSPEGGFCDAPEAVLIGFGAVSRHVFMAPAAAMEPCVRSALLAHEGQHERMLEEAVHAFIQQHRQELAQELVELKGKRASDQGAAAKAFETGLEISMARMLNEFKQEQVDRIRQ